MAISDLLLFSKLAAACHPSLPDTVRTAALEAIAARPGLCVDGLENVLDARAILRAVLASESIELVALATPLLRTHAFQGETLLAQRDVPTWGGDACPEVGRLLATASGMQAQPIFAFLMLRYGDEPYSQLFQSLVDSVLLVEDDSWTPHDAAMQSLLIRTLARTLPNWKGAGARTRYLDRIRACTTLDAWITAVRSHPTHNRNGVLVRAATWLALGTDTSVAVFHQALGLSGHAALGLSDLLPDWDAARKMPQPTLERDLLPFFQHMKTLTTT